VSERSPIKALLACDLDGTLIAEDGSPAPGIVEALAELDACGVPLVVCTGRPLHGAMKATAVLHADPLAYVCYHGALVVDAATGEWLRHLTIPVDVASLIVREAQGLGLAVTLYDGDERRELVPVAGGARHRHTGDAGGAARGLSASAGITRLVVSGGPPGVEAALPGLAASWERSTRLERAGGGTVAILPLSADKGEGLRLVAARLAVPLARVVACGDAAADESLLRTAGIAIAVGDPPDAALAAADERVAQEGLAPVLLRRVESLLRLA
jgi:hydroxymethylpyrimidine pyrophosphatase-like HAD family hydrolase